MLLSVFIASVHSWDTKTVQGPEAQSLLESYLQSEIMFTLPPPSVASFTWGDCKYMLFSDQQWYDYCTCRQKFTADQTMSQPWVECKKWYTLWFC